MSVEAENKERKPTFKQQWVLSMTDGTLLYIGHLKTDTYGPFRCENDSTVTAFLKRMENSGWLSIDSNPGFRRLTYKAIMWKKTNRKSSFDYYQEYMAKHKL